jgi:hypothetical protein
MRVGAGIVDALAEGYRQNLSLRAVRGAPRLSRSRASTTRRSLSR